MRTLAKWAVLIGTGVVLAGCQSEQERLMAQRDTVMSSCRERAQASATIADVERFCTCLADSFEAAGTNGQPDTIAIGEQCEARAEGPGPNSVP